MHADVATEPLAQHWNRIANAECRKHRALGIIVMRHGSAEHGHDAVTDVLVDSAAVLDDCGVGNFEECGENALDLLGVEQLTQGGISREIHKEDRDLSALAWSSFALLNRRPLGACKRIGACLVAQQPDCVEQPTPMTDRADTEIPEIIRRQVRQQIAGDVIVVKLRRVLV